MFFRMARSNAPQALSVVTVTQEGDVSATVKEIMKFDGKAIGFSHEKTWASMSAALQGVFTPESVIKQLQTVHPRVAKSIAALCELGLRRPLQTFDLRNFPNSGLRPVEGLRIGPEVMLMAKASCWYVENGEAVIPILQPRLDHLSSEKLAMYASLGRRAFCRRDWVNANIEIIDLSGLGGSKNVEAKVIDVNQLPEISEDRLNDFLRTYIEAQSIASALRALERDSFTRNHSLR
jgi:hypothetical protein